jgi:histidine triad (HIT) family protein
LIALAALLLASGQQPNVYTGEVDPATGLQGPYDQRNPFARIIRGEMANSAAVTVHETNQLLVIMPLTMATPGHVLVIPKRLGARTLLDLTPDELSACMLAVQQAAKAQVKALGATGFKLTQNNGITSDQHVYHPHFHVMPSFGANQKYRRDADRNTREELETMAKRLKAAWPE